MKLIVGLGNPGLFYSGTRHNIGFRVIKALARKFKVALKKDGAVYALSVKTNFGDHDLVLAQPLTFMNLSGNAVKALVHKYKINPDDILIICDDLDLELGRLKLRAKGSSGGQRGLSSIISSLGTQDFCRLRLGIGRPNESMALAKGCQTTALRPVDASKYVLEPFKASEKKEAEDLVEQAVILTLMWIEKGQTEAMSMFNKRKVE